MRKWNFKVKDNTKTIIKKLNATIGVSKGFEFDLDYNANDSATFRIQKKGLYAFYLIFLNKITVNGIIKKTATENETELEISFTQYLLWRMVIFATFLVGVCYFLAIISGIETSPSLFLPMGILFGAGAVLLIGVQQKFNKDVKEYKTLLSSILEN